MFKLELNGTRLTLRALLAAALLSVTVPGVAFHFPWDQGHDTTASNDPPPPGPDDRPPCDPCNGGATASPVYAALGHAIWQETDLKLRGRPALGVFRAYNSNDPVVGLFGNGWSADFDIALYPATSSGTQMRVFKAANGKRFNYIRQADGTYKTPEARFDTVTEGPTTVTMTMLDGRRNVFAFDGRLLEQWDANNNRIAFSYDAAARPVRLDDGNGRFINIAYNGASLVGTITDHGGRTWRYTYDAAGNLTAVTDPAGGRRTYTWQSYRPPADANTYYQLLSVVDASGVAAVNFTYSGNQVASYTDGANRFTYTRPTSNTKLAGTVTRTDALGVRTSFTYGAQGLITQDTDGLNFTTRYTYDVNGRLTQTTDALGRAWPTGYDALGRLVSSGNPLGETMTLQYTGNNPRPSKTISAAGRSATMAYDGAGNVTALTDQGGAVTRIAYNPRGDVSTVVNALGQQTILDYNAVGLPLRIVDPLGRITTLAYDALGRLATSTLPDGRATSYAYDSLDRSVSSRDASDQMTTYSYDPAGRLLGATDAKGSVTSYAYDTFGRRISRTAPDGSKTQYSWRADNLLDRLTWPDATFISYQYDNNKRLTSETAGTETTSYTYDQLNQLTRVSGPGGVVSFTYDTAGRVATETSNGKTHTVARNPDGERTRLDALAQSTQYTRDNRGFVTRIAAASGNFDFNYDAAGQRTALSYPNGSTASYGYDAGGQLTTLSHSGAFSASYSHDFDAAGRITRVSGDGPDWNYGYDATGRLTSAVHGTQATTYTLDAVGNILDNGRVYDVNHRLTQDTAKTYTYDQRGNLTLERDRTSGARVAYTWNVKNQLLRVDSFADATGTTPTRRIQYTYDPLGRRASKTDNGAAQLYTYDGFNLIGMLDSSSNVLATHTFGTGIDEPLARISGGQTRFLHADRLGSIVGLSDTGSTRTRYAYAPYGATALTGEASANPFTFTGREMDTDSLMFFRARYYSPTTTRFLSADVPGFRRGWNPYVYGNANPVRFIDPTGTTGQDKWYGYNDKGFRDWVHGQKQQEGRGASENYGKDELKDLWDQWNEEGRPRGKGGKSGRGGQGKGEQCEPGDEAPAEPEGSSDPSPSSNDNTALYVAGGVLLVIGIGALIFFSGGMAAPALAFASDRHIKENLAEVDSDEVLQGLAALPVSTWNYKSEGARVKHLGPMAQDFKAAFALGARDTEIAMVDASGVLIVSVQALKRQLDEKTQQIDVLQQQLSQCLARLERLERPVPVGVEQDAA